MSESTLWKILFDTESYFRDKIAVDLFSETIRAWSSNQDGLIFEETMESFELSDLILITKEEMDQTDKLHEILSKIMEQVGSHFYRPYLLMSCPSQKDKDFRQNLRDFCLHHLSIKNVYLIDICILAAIACGLPAQEPVKSIFIFTPDNEHVYATMIFGGGLFGTRVMKKSVNQLNSRNVLQEINRIKDEVPDGLPEGFSNYEEDFYDEDVELLKNLKEGWNDTVQNVHVCMSEEHRSRFRDVGDEYNMSFSSNRKKVLKGLKAGLEEFDWLKEWLANWS